MLAMQQWADCWQTVECHLTSRMGMKTKMAVCGQSVSTFVIFLTSDYIMRQIIMHGLYYCNNIAHDSSETRDGS